MATSTTPTPAFIAVTTAFNGAAFANLTTLTALPLKGGKKNPLQGRVTKLSENANVMLFTSGAGYQNRVNKLLREERGENAPTFESQPLKWGKRVQDTPVIVHTKDGELRFYLQVLFLNAPKNVSLFVDGRPATPEEVEAIRATENKPNTAKLQEGLQRHVHVRPYAFDSIVSLRAGGHEVTNADLAAVVEQLKALVTA